MKVEHRQVAPPMQNRKKGIAAVLIAWFFFTIAIAISRKAGEVASVPTILLFQNSISFIVILVWMIVKKKGKRSLYLSKPGVITIRSLAGYISFAFIFLAVERTSLINVVLLSNSAPLFIPFIIWAWKKVKISPRLWLGIIIGFIGIVVILKPTHNIINLGALFGLGSALCLSISMIAQRRLVKTERTVTVLFYYFLISIVLSIPFAIETWVPLNLSTVGFLIVLGLCSVVGQIIFFRGFKYEKPSFLSSFNYSSVVYGAIIEWVFWDRFPGWSCILGILIVCTGGIITIRQGNGRFNTNRNK